MPMGFGWLFFGYVLEYILGMSPYGCFTFLIGYGVMYRGLCELRRYCHSFIRAVYCLIPLSVVALLRTIQGFDRLFSWGTSLVDPPWSQIALWADLVLVLAFHFFLMLSVRELATRVSSPKQAVYAMRNFIIFLLYACVYTLWHTNVLADTRMYGVLLLLQLIWSILNSVMLYSCYMHICPAQEPERPPSRFAWVNRFRARFEQKENDAIEADRRYHAENARRRREKYLSSLSEKQRKKEQKKHNESNEGK